MANELLAWVQQDHEVLAIDLETTGLDFRDDDAAIRLAQIGSYDQGWAIPWEHWSGVFLEVLEAWNGPLVGQNIIDFDAAWLKFFTGWEPPYDRLHDTLIMAQLCEPHLPAGLKAVGDRHIDRRASSGQKLLDQAMKLNDWTWDTVPVDLQVYWMYGCIDTVLTAHVFRHYRADLKYPEAYALEMSARRVVTEMKANGIRIDMEYCEQQMKKLHDYAEESKQWGIDNWGVNILSNVQVIDLFQNRLKAPITRVTNSGGPSVDKIQREKFLESEDPQVRQAAQFITDVKNAQKKADSYFKNFLTYQHDGILHADFKTLAARTGRMSTTRPALQTIGKEDTVLRDAFLPHEGQVLLSCDYSQIELRLMCHFSDDQALAEAFRTADATGGDFFVQMGRDIYKDETFHKKDPRRNLIKNFMYSYLYGAGLNKMAATAGVSPEEMRSFVTALAETYPGIPEFQKRVIQTGDQRERSEGQGYIITPFNRRIPCDEGQSRTLVNYLLQGHAAEILKDALVKMDAAGLTQYLLLPIHDEVIASVPPDEYEEIAQEIGELMTVRGKYAVDLIAEAEGPFQRWGDKIRIAA